MVVGPAPLPAPVGSVEFQEQLAAAGQAYRRAGVRYLYLLHGTFAGEDAFGVFGEIGRFFPEVGDSLRALGKETFDSLVGEAGNYTAEYAEQLQAGLNAPTDRAAAPGGGQAARHCENIEVRRFLWSSENHHIARADAAVALLDELAELQLQPGERVLLWCHSHAGNAAALLTNLLAAGERDRTRFFRACRLFYRWPLLQRVDVSRWSRVRQMLQRNEHPLSRNPPDVVTFGTPVRYGWDTNGAGRLLHFLHHHASVEPPHVARFPPSTEDLLSGRGDFIQQAAIAGTDFPPGPVVWRSWLADWRLSRLLAPNLPRSGLLSRLRLGHRVHADGRNLLFDYGPQEGTIAHHFFGHAVYTRQMWMAFHAEQVADLLYTDV